MTKAAKVAISLPEELLQCIEMERQATGETRSEFLRRAVEAFLLRERERELDEQYVRGYLETPETSEEVGGMYRAGLAALAQEPWEDGDDQ
ncbi:MAG: ribbon-helix-helix protein, CopG family [Chloroflexi bacterium]|nr:ribbon-helix-helix protein, CopG family [Chloroflexota bacterium]